MKYIKIDNQGNPEGFPIEANNIYHIMGDTWDFTAEELATAGFAELVNGDQVFFNGSGLYDVTVGPIVKNPDGTIEQTWIKTEISTEEKKRRWVDRKRQNLLYQSDWTALPDVNLSAEGKQAWITYRQALRDIPQTINLTTVTSEDQIVWPQIPGGPVPLIPQPN